MTGELVSDAQLHTALAALGLREIHSVDPARPVQHGFLLGVLLAVVESALRADRGRRRRGHGPATGGRCCRSPGTTRRPPTADRKEALLLQERLHRAATQLRGGPEGERVLADVAGPAALAAANLLTLLHHAAPAPRQLCS